MARKKRVVEEVNSSSTADIAFLLLIFFLVTTSMDTDKGLARRLPPPAPKDAPKTDINVKERNVLIVLLNSNNQLMVEGLPLDVKQLCNKAKEFITNPTNSPNLPEVFDVNVAGMGKMKVTTNHVISLQNDRGTEYQAYIEVQNELIRAYNELRDDLASAKFGKPYNALSEDQKKSVQEVYPQKISEAEPKNYGGAK
ncbi:MAG: biopolymer transporter ExbD [Bacteroidales bacterium]|nr:biopolymer transporter ExbD [Bacteroidales bacterium]